MNEIFLLKLGEIILKGANKRSFEDRLRTNVARRMRPFGDFKVSILQSTVYVEPENDQCDLEAAWDACHAIFGAVSICRSRPCEKNADAIFAAILAYLGDDLSAAKSFIECGTCDLSIFSGLYASTMLQTRTGYQYPSGS